METKLIYGKIAEVMGALGAVGKNKKNVQQGYSFRGIDDMYNALNTHLADAKIFFTSDILSKEREERETKNGGNLLYTILRIKWTIWAEDGSSVTTETVGEAMDSGDKSCNKAMSAAYKYALMQVFCIPTEEPKDTEHETHEVKPKPIVRPAPVTPSVPQSVTATGNPRGTISDAQLKAIHAVASQLGIDEEKLNARTMELHGVRVSGLSKEQATTIIDKLVAAAPKQSPIAELHDDKEMTPEIIVDAMSIEQVAEAMGGTVVPSPMEQVKAAMDATRTAIRNGNA